MDEANKLADEKWHVVCEKTVADFDGEREYHEAKIWTLSRWHDQPGWQTDGGYEGYGLARADAVSLADAFNTAIVREAVARKCGRREGLDDAAQYGFKMAKQTDRPRLKDSLFTFANNVRVLINQT